MKVHEFYTDESKWTQNVLARDEKDQPVSVYRRTAVKFCLRGIIFKLYPLEVACHICKTVESKIGYLGDWNDTHTFEEVVDLAKQEDF